jgi:glycosyltransferase 2 family protein
MNLKKRLIAIARFMLFFGIGIFFIWLFLRTLTHDQKAEILRSFSYANYWWISISIILGVLSHFLRTLRWRMLIEPMGYFPGKRNTFLAVMIGYLANLALPRLGEVSRCTVLTQYEGVPFNKSFGTVITERAIDLIMFIFLFFFNLALQFDKLSKFIEVKIYNPIEAKFHLTMDLSGSLSLIALGILTFLLLVFFIFRKQIMQNKVFLKIRNMVMGFLEGMKSLLKVKRLWLFAVYSLSIWALYLIMAYLVFFSLPETAHLGIDAGLAALVFGTIGIMIVQGGIGIYPAIVAETLVLYSVSPTSGYALGWLIWSSQTLTIIIIGSLSLILLPILNKKKNYVEA